MSLGDPERAVRLLSAASRLREAIGVAPRETAKERTAANMKRLRSELSDEDFRAAWERGQEMSLQEATKVARDATVGAPASA